MLAELSQYKHDLPILAGLLKKGRVNMSELAEETNLNNRNTLIRSVDHLENMKLIQSEYTSSWPLQKFVWLTPKGKKVAAIIVELEKALNEE